MVGEISPPLSQVDEGGTDAESFDVFATAAAILPIVARRVRRWLASYRPSVARSPQAAFEGDVDVLKTASEVIRDQPVGVVTHEPVTGKTNALSSADAAGVHVTLIRPPILTVPGAYSTPITPPLGIAYLTAIVEETGASVTAIDGVAEKMGQEPEDGGYVRHGLSIPETIERIPPGTDIIGLSCMFTQDWPFTLRLIRAIRERFPDKLIIVGGEHITALTEFSLHQCPELDLCVLGEGEETLAELIGRFRRGESLFDAQGIAYLRQGEMVRTEPRSRIRNVDDLPLPAWDHFPIEVYLENRNGFGVYYGRTMGILATRGCPYKCTFCSNPLMYGNLWMPRSPDKVLDEIELYHRKYGATNIDFYDLTFVIRKSWILEFCRLIEARGLKFTWQLPTGTRSEVIDEEVAAALYRTGCRNMAYAPESGSQETLKIIKKQVDLVNLVDSIRSVMRQGMVVRVNLILGFPHETRRDIWRTIFFSWKLAAIGVHDAGFYLFSPYPGTEIFDQLRADGTIGELDEKYFRALLAFKNFFQPNPYCKHMNGRELSVLHFFALASYFVVQYSVRPWRFLQLGAHVLRNCGVTSLEQRLAHVWAERKKRRATVAKSRLETSTART